ncbi:adenine deaminase [Muriicola sp. Z0-33]|uniref:adenine deaminase n=1 Tax=Muriicola sp. Z0-33 TaxID=2816957 RepID=UPI0022371053|nr:adenine deaminase [Muriicola sp. Z0-33]MCW5514799.1 adenine deaminase [Muriicola sp. Z0-33]
MKKIEGQIVDIPARNIYPGEITISEGKILSLTKKANNSTNYILPGFIDAHIHIESAMLVPSEFARLAVCHGTIATVSDPHEIANVLGVEGVRFMIENGKKVPLKFHFGAPSCVPATNFETSGARINSEEISKLLASEDIYFLAEMMNYPGVLNEDPEVLKKISAAKKIGKPVDGHSPGLRGAEARKYIEAGISTDHECVSYEEAKEKLALGMKVIIREGSAAKNFEALIALLPENAPNMMFCSDDKHPDDLMLGHINQLCARAVAKGINIFEVLQAACINPVVHYKMDVGLLKQGDAADFILVEDLKDFNVVQTYINGKLVAENNTSLVDSVPFETPNNFNISPKTIADFHQSAASPEVRAITAMDGELITGEQLDYACVKDGKLVSNIENDILKIAVVNRYKESSPAIGFIKNFGMKKGAIASSVAHDSHNIIAIGTTDEEICRAVNLIIKNKGGICAVDKTTEKCLALPVAGIMSAMDGEKTALAYEEMDATAKFFGSPLTAPFMTLAFMGLLVIPDLKLSDKGLFSGKTFDFVNLQG